MLLTALQQRTLQVAKRLVGKREATGRNDGWIARLTQRAVDPLLTWLENQPWCVCFVVYCVHTAAGELGVRSILPKLASSSLLYSWAKRNGKLLAKPVSGCIGLVRRGGSGDHDGRGNAGKSHIHTFFVHTVLPDGTLITVEGNFRNAVCWNRRRAPYGCDFVEIC
jgi:hypothetical protein